jgi:hypothetical protein
MVAAEITLVTIGVRALWLSMCSEPRVADVYLRWSDRMHEHPWLLHCLPLAVSAWGILIGIRDVSRSEDTTEAALRVVFPLLSLIGLALTVRVWRLHPADGGDERTCSSDP